MFESVSGVFPQVAANCLIGVYPPVDGVYRGGSSALFGQDPDDLFGREVFPDKLENLLSGSFAISLVVDALFLRDFSLFLCVGASVLAGFWVSVAGDLPTDRRLTDINQTGDLALRITAFPAGRNSVPLFSSKMFIAHINDELRINQHFRGMSF